MFHELIIGVFTVAAVGCLAFGLPIGNVFGLMASPSWLITTWASGQYGKFAPSVLCAAFYAAGLIKWIAE